MTDRDERDESDILEERAALVSKLTHEIRGPVSTIRGLAGTTLTHYDRLDDGERREFLGLIRHEAERLERTVEQVALALKLDAGTVRFDIRRQDLGVIVRGAAEATETGDHPLEVDVDDGLEAPVDATQIAFVVRQLLENAVAFSPSDAPIAIALRRGGRRRGHRGARSRPRDPGGPTRGRLRALRRMAPARTTRIDPEPGSACSSRATIARAHGGDASIADGPAGGTMLIVRLPAGGTNGGHPVTTLLICDDHKVLTDALATVVGLDDGLQLVAPPVHDPETAIELSAEHLPDVVLMDIVFKGGCPGSRRRGGSRRSRRPRRS